MAFLYRDLQPNTTYHHHLYKGTHEEYLEALKKSSTLYVGNLSFYTTEEQIWELFSKVGEVKRIIMGLNRRDKTPCGFCFVEYYTHEAAADCVNYISGTRLDDRPIRADWDPGFVEGRQYGRGRTGGQIRDEYRTDFDPGRPLPEYDSEDLGTFMTGGYVGYGSGNANYNNPRPPRRGGHRRSRSYDRDRDRDDRRGRQSDTGPYGRDDRRRRDYDRDDRGRRDDYRREPPREVDPFGRDVRRGDDFEEDAEKLGLKRYRDDYDDYYDYDREPKRPKYYDYDDSPRGMY